MAGHLVYSFMVSVDGYIATAKGDIGLPVPEEALHRHFNDAQSRSALGLYGPNMFEVMQYWDAPPADSKEYEREFARVWQATPKVVVLRESYPSKEAFDAAGTGAADAMVETFDQLDELLVALGESSGQ